MLKDARVVSGAWNYTSSMDYLLKCFASAFIMITW